MSIVTSMPRALARVLLIVAACGCVRPPHPPQPAPDPAFTRARVDSARADSIRAERERREAIRADSTRAALADSIARARADSIARAAARVRVCAGGDLLLSTNLDTTWAVRRGADPFPDPDELLAPLRPLVDDAEMVLLNIEGAIGEGEAPSKCREGSTNCYAFRQPIAVADAIRRIAPDAAVVGNVANNHARDAGDAGLRATVRHLESAGVHVTGSDTLATLIPLMEGDTIAVLGFSTSGGGPDPRDLDAVRRHVARAAAAHDRVVVTMHMGAEGSSAQRTPNATEIFLGSIDRGNSVAFARTAVDAGADLVVGHGPHVMRAGEWRDDALILYSLGNLLTYGPFSLSEPKNRGAIACAVLDASGAVTEAVLRSTVQRAPGVADVDPSGRAAFLVDSLSRLDFPGTGVVVGAEGVLQRAP